MSEEEQFVNIDLNDDNICSVCKLETHTETLSFCHVCFELSIEGVCGTTLLHSTSLRGHRDCFEKYHLIANQKLSRAKGSRSAYEGVKSALSQKINRLVQYAQNREAASESARRGGKHPLLCYSQQGDRTLVPQSDSHVPRYAPRWAEGVAAAAGLPDCGQGMLERRGGEELVLGAGGCGLWAGGKRTVHRNQQQGGGPNGLRQHRHPGLGREELAGMSAEELGQLKGQLLLQIQKVFEELTAAVQDKDSLASELHVRHIAIEQLFKNCAKLPWLQIGRAGVKANNNTPVE
ncbi:protein EURL homolog [Conger conger]|uniref:protein EURL homolog n=1 Tax=Conger conger TaxID=82655 RepID=UPI002A5ADD2B|nr:protein EURL homolog [Conger conger]